MRKIQSITKVLKEEWKLIVYFICLIVVINLLSYTYKKYPALIPEINIGFSSEAISALIGLFGVVVGVLLTNFYTRKIERDKKKVEMISEFVAISYELKIHLKRVKRAQLKNNIEELSELEIYNLKLCDQLQNLSIKFWALFKSVWVKAAINRFTKSYLIITEQVLDINPIDGTKIDTSIFWIESQTSEIIPLLMKNARVPTKVKEGPIFVGFRKVTPIDKEKLKFEIEYPPWEPAIIFDYRIEPTAEVMKNIRDANLSRIKNLKCKKHGYAPHLIFSSKSIDSVLNIAVIACCEEFANTTSTKI